LDWRSLVEGAVGAMLVVIADYEHVQSAKSTVSTLKKSQATIPLAWALRNSRHVGRPRRRIDPGVLKDRPNRAGRDPDAESGELDLDPAVAPSRALPCHPQDQHTDSSAPGQRS
jgi:hypothetical protein